MKPITRETVEKLSRLMRILDELGEKNQTVGRLLSAPAIHGTASFGGTEFDGRFRLTGTAALAVLKVIQEDLIRQFEQISAEAKALGFVEDEAEKTAE